jgi:hypothetical protein
MALESEVIARAPASAIAWNRRATAVNDKPDDLVDETIARIGYGASQCAALEWQRDQHQENLASLGRPVARRKTVTSHDLTKQIAFELSRQPLAQISPKNIKFTSGRTA